MPISSILRKTPAVWLFPILVLAVFQYLRLNAPFRSEYALQLTSDSAVWTLSLAGPVCAALAAWEAGRLRRAGWYELPHARSTFQVVLASIAPVLIVGYLTLGLAIVFQFIRRGAPGLRPYPDARVVLSAMIVILALTLVGFAAGRWLPTIIAVPGILIGAWCWLALPVSFRTPWVRHLNGVWHDCCSIQSDLSWRVVVGTLVIAAGLIVSATVLLRQHSSVKIVFLSIIPIVVASTIGVELVHKMDTSPEVPRDPAELVCTSQGVRICAWPEHAYRLSKIEAEVERVTSVWRNDGISIPSTFTEQLSGKLPPNAVSLALWSEMTRQDLDFQLAVAMVPQMPACAYKRGYPVGGPTPGFKAQPYLITWFAESAGVPTSYLTTQFSPDVSAQVAKVRAMPEAKQLTWVAQNAKAVGSCDSPARLGTN